MVEILSKKNITSLSACSFSLGFSFSTTHSSSPISLSLDIVCIVFVAVLIFFFFAGTGGVGNIDVCSLLKKGKLSGYLVGGGGGSKGSDGGLLLLNKSLEKTVAQEYSEAEEAEAEEVVG